MSQYIVELEWYHRGIQQERETYKYDRRYKALKKLAKFYEKRCYITIYFKDGRVVDLNKVRHCDGKGWELVEIEGFDNRGYLDMRGQMYRKKGT